MKNFTPYTACVLALALSVTLLLQGCFPVVAVGIGASALMAADRRNTETYVTDEGIELRMLTRINEKYGTRIHVNATSYNFRVLLTGEVPDEKTKTDIAQEIASIPNVRKVFNEIQTTGFTSLSSRANDAMITGEIKTRFLAANKFQPNYVKVITEAGVVYLMGLVTQREADDATNITRHTKGVRSVVRLFEETKPSSAKTRSKKTTTLPVEDSDSKLEKAEPAAISSPISTPTVTPIVTPVPE